VDEKDSNGFDRLVPYVNAGSQSQASESSFLSSQSHSTFKGKSVDRGDGAPSVSFDCHARFVCSIPICVSSSLVWLLLPHCL